MNDMFGIMEKWNIGYGTFENYTFGIMEKWNVGQSRI